MLRLPPSQIDLGTNDLSWHTQRLRKRQAEHSAGIPAAPSNTHQDHQPYTQGQHGSLSYRFPPPRSTAIPQATNSAPNNSIIKEEPVPRDTRAFWDGLVAQVERPLYVPYRFSPRRPRRVAAEISNASAENSDPAPSSDGESPDPPQRQDDSSPSREYPDHLSESEGTVSAKSRSSSVLAQSDPDEEYFSFNESIEEEGSDDGFAATDHTGLFESSDAALQSVNEDLSQIQDHFSDQMDLDGSADGHLSRRTRNLSLTVEFDTTSDDDNFLGSGDRGPGLVDTGDNLTDNDKVSIMSTSMGLPDRESTPPPPARGMEIHKRRPATLPRSRLHISHAAISSSPEKRGRNQDSTSNDSTDHPPRRHKSYKPRSESCSLPESQIGKDLTHTDDEREDLMASSEPPEVPSSPPELIDFLGGPSGLPHPDSYRDFAPQFSPLYASLQRSNTHDLFYNSQNLLSTEGGSSPGLPSNVLPPPFSASARMVSLELALPSSPQESQPSSPASILRSSARVVESGAESSSLRSPSDRSSLPSAGAQSSEDNMFRARLLELNHTIAYHASEEYQQPTPPRRSLYRNRTPITAQPQPRSQLYVPSPSPPPPMTPHRSMRVYNDRLPAYSQPQTPANLRRHPVVDAAFTAPARFPRSRLVTPTRSPRRETRTPRSRMGSRNLGQRDSPLALSSFVIDEEQENISAEEELERRMEALRAWRDVRYRDREERQGRLERTPPREMRYDWEGGML